MISTQELLRTIYTIILSCGNKLQTLWLSSVQFCSVLVQSESDWLIHNKMTTYLFTVIPRKAALVKMETLRQQTSDWGSPLSDLCPTAGVPTLFHAKAPKQHPPLQTVL